MTRDGSLYRVDLRLRPHGKDGALAISRGSFADYIKNNAAIWEMLAFVKLRGVGGNLELAKTTEAEIRELIFEKAKNIPSGNLAEETHRIRIGLEMQRTGPRRKHQIDIKYGSGGMLDIYFAIRFLQLRDNVRDDTADRSTGRTLELLRDAGSLTGEQFNHFKNGYDFLSALDHYLRLTIGRSTLLPQANLKALSLVAERMNIQSPGELLEHLTAHRLDIRNAFDEILGHFSKK
jgi:glutamate-ammonia-ligase adenylyltransferase